MEPSQFDKFTKSLATPASRRNAIKALLASVAGSIFALSGIGRAFARRQCPPGLTNCSGKCVNLNNDPKHCGDCDVKCASGLCVNGLCCPPGAVQCGNSCCSFTCCGGNTCVDINNDKNNCGSCGNVCPSTATCNSGKCICPTGSPPCGNTCCTTGQVCLNGNTCCASTQVCGSTCCPAGQVCQGGTCVVPTCTGQTCGSFVPGCDNNAACYCFMTAEGTSGCGPSVPCASQQCTKSSDCPSGSFCAVSTCCGAVGICVPNCTPGLSPSQATGQTTTHP